MSSEPRYQPFMLEMNCTLSALPKRLHAAWPNAHKPAARNHTIRTITKHIQGALPQDAGAQISIFLSNAVDAATSPAPEGFLYHLARQHIITHGPTPSKNADHSLLHVHYVTTEKSDAQEIDNTTKNIAISRITQITQWQKETVKAMFQAMADTSLAMEAQTALRGISAGLKKLDALLRNTKKQVIGVVAARGTVQRGVKQNKSQEITQTLSELRSHLAVAGGAPDKPSSNAQRALRQQLKKLDGIIGTPPKIQAKLHVKKIAKLGVIKHAHVSPSTLTKITATRNAPQKTPSTITRRAHIATRILKAIMVKARTPTKAHQNILAKIATRSRPTITRSRPRFQISRQRIVLMKFTPDVLAKYTTATQTAAKTVPTRMARAPARYAALTTTAGINPAAMLRTQLQSAVLRQHIPNYRNDALSATPPAIATTQMSIPAAPVQTAAISAVLVSETIITAVPAQAAPQTSIEIVAPQVPEAQKSIEAEVKNDVPRPVSASQELIVPVQNTTPQPVSATIIENRIQDTQPINVPQNATPIVNVQSPPQQIVTPSGVAHHHVTQPVIIQPSVIETPVKQSAEAPAVIPNRTTPTAAINSTTVKPTVQEPAREAPQAQTPSNVIPISKYTDRQAEIKTQQPEQRTEQQIDRTSEQAQKEKVVTIKRPEAFQSTRALKDSYVESEERAFAGGHSNVSYRAYNSEQTEMPVFYKSDILSGKTIDLSGLEPKHPEKNPAKVKVKLPEFLCGC